MCHYRLLFGKGWNICDILVGKQKAFKWKTGIGTGDRGLKEWEAEWN